MRFTFMDHRWPAAIGAVLLEALLVLALFLGLAIGAPRVADEEVSRFALLPPAKIAESAKPAPRRNARREGRASPPNLRGKATAVTAPPPLVKPIVPPPIVAAPVTGPGAAAFAGASEVRGPGTGSGGVGDGTGSGGDGDGDGGGWDETPPVRIGGRLKDSDYPDAAAEAGVGGTVSVRYLVTVDGRARDCTVTRSSGSALLDATTCRLIERRFRFEPSRDERGRAVPSQVVERHSWDVERTVEQ